MDTALVWVQFIICLVIIIVAGSRVARYGDLLGKKTGLGRVWIGVVVLAAITSLPELATGISSVTFLGQPDLTVGNLFGASLINLMIIAIIDLVFTRGHVLLYLGSGIVLSTVFSVMMIAGAAVSIYLVQEGLGLTVFGHIGIYSLMLFCFYLFSQYVILRFQPEVIEAQPFISPVPPPQDLSLRKLFAMFSLASVATIGAGVWLAFIGSQIAEITGLSATLVGVFFLAICTTAPEMVVSISAVRLGALDMAVGNLVGSNLFNMGVVIFIDDIFFTAGPILQNVDTAHIVAALFAISMSCIVIIGIVFKPKRWLKYWVGIDTVALAILYFGAVFMLYLLGR